MGEPSVAPLAGTTDSHRREGRRRACDEQQENAAEGLQGSPRFLLACTLAIEKFYPLDIFSKTSVHPIALPREVRQ